MRYANQQRAFTIIELLVVIGVIAVLSAILLPAIGTASNNAKTTTASSNLRQIGTAVAKYQNQNKDRFIDNKYNLGRWLAPQSNATPDTLDCSKPWDHKSAPGAAYWGLPLSQFTGIGKEAWHDPMTKYADVDTADIPMDFPDPNFNGAIAEPNPCIHKWYLSFGLNAVNKDTPFNAPPRGWYDDPSGRRICLFYRSGARAGEGRALSGLKHPDKALVCQSHLEARIEGSGDHCWDANGDGVINGADMPEWSQHWKECFRHVGDRTVTLWADGHTDAISRNDWREDYYFGVPAPQGFANP